MTTHKVNWGLVATLALALVGWLLSGAADVAAMKARIAVVEAKQTDGDRWRERMEGKVDRILERLK